MKTNNMSARGGSAFGGKKLLIIAIILIGVIYAPNVFAEEISNFEVFVQINKDSSVNVTEKIVYDFGDLQRHGIYRTIPIKYKARGGNYNLRISDIEVMDGSLSKLNYTVSYPDNYIELKIGDADKYMTGQQTYYISYKINRAINYFDNHDELYWNVTGDEWPVEINNIKATVMLPSLTDEILKECYVGVLGSEDKCNNKTLVYDQANERIGYVFEHDYLADNEGLTVVMGFAKGLVIEPTVQQKIIYIVQDNWILGVPILVFLFMLYYWFIRGKDPQGRGIVIAQFDSPDGISPSLVGAIVDEKVNRKDVVSEIIHLAVNGYLKIVQEKTKTLKRPVFKLKKMKDPDQYLYEFQMAFMTSLFESGDLVSLNDLKDKFYTDFEAIIDKVYKKITEDKYFIKNPKAVRLTYRIISFIIFGITAFFGFYWGWLGFISLLVSGVIIFIFSFFMPQRTKKGVLAKEHILGLKEYLTVAEKDRLKFHNAPEKNPQTFERLLPFAIALGVEDQWAKQFKDIYSAQKPQWIESADMNTFNSLNLINSLSTFNSKATSILTSRPSSSGSSASSGFSGFSSGGGFSGGGFGGGGGGSW